MQELSGFPAETIDVQRKKDPDADRANAVKEFNAIKATQDRGGSFVVGTWGAKFPCGKVGGAGEDGASCSAGAAVGSIEERLVEKAFSYLPQIRDMLRAKYGLRGS